MKPCNKKGCRNKVPPTIIVNGELKNLQHRKFCFVCSPFKSHNTRDLNATRKTTYENVKAFRLRNKQKAIDYKGGKCHLCGYNRCHRAMKFHHLDPSKKDFTIGQAKAWSFDRIKKELDKCVMLCGNCHDEVHDGIATL